MATETMTNDTHWPAVGNPTPPIVSPEDPNPEWEMIAEDEENQNTKLPSNNNNIMDNSVVILPQQGRPRSATIGGEAALSTHKIVGRASSGIAGTANSVASSGPRRTVRRCASTPDLLMSDSAHEVIVEDESDSEETYENSGSEGAERNIADLEESFEVLSEKDREGAGEGEGEGEDEPVMIDEDSGDSTGEEESATLVSTPSVGTSSWTMASSAVADAPKTTTAGVWGMKKSMSFKDMLAKNMDKPASVGTGEFGKDKVSTEAKLRDSHRRHHLRVRTKPKFVVTDNTNNTDNNGGGKKMMKHAHSTGDLTEMLTAVEEGHESSFGNGRRNRRVKKQLSAMMEEEDEGADFVIGRGSGNGSSGGGGGGGDYGGGEVLGDTDANDYYSRKDHGLRSTSNKKKERPDEAKRREIIMHKKDMQRKKQQAAESQKGSADADAKSGGKKKKKNEKGFGGKKERRRL